MPDFEYVRPQNMSEAVDFLKVHGSETRILAGGTDLLIQLRNDEISSPFILDVKRISELQTGIQQKNGVVSISASATVSEIILNNLINAYFPALITAAKTIGSVQIRNRATIAGNICNASPAADSAPPLLVYGAQVVIAGSKGMRRIPLNEFFIRSGVTALQKDELVAAIELPVPTTKMGAAYLRRTRRRGHDLASVTLCCAIEQTGTVRLAYGSVGPRPVLVVDKSGILVDKKASDEAKMATLESMFAQASPSKTSMRASPAYRLAMLRVLGKEGLDLAISALDELNEGEKSLNEGGK
ncbi:MAG TPA: xanthine dehydrogenase family protein subunit M [Spirochaetales bacterium]|nr:xanthine dehydrogenase family protein subunit M [Spirochaetales bacterium]